MTLEEFKLKWEARLQSTEDYNALIQDVNAVIDSIKLDNIPDIPWWDDRWESTMRW
jgi:hypothetical protein